jgi:hypothetical protein
VGGVSFSPPTALAMLVVLDGEPLNPGVDFTKLCAASAKDAIAQRLAKNLPFNFNKI